MLLGVKDEKETFAGVFPELVVGDAGDISAVTNRGKKPLAARRARWYFGVTPVWHPPWALAIVQRERSVWGLGTAPYRPKKVC